MALKLNEAYPGRYNNPSADYPQGSFKNRTTPTAQDGSYFEQRWSNDQLALFSSLLDAAGIDPNGEVDKVGSSQYFEALLAVIQENAGDTLNAPTVTISAAPNISLTDVDPDTSQLVISGSGVNIGSFAVAANRFFAIRFSGSVTLANSASLITGSGSNISVSSGDSCIIRSISANVVEVMLFSKGARPQSLSPNGYKIFSDGSATPLIDQWGRFQQAPGTSGNIAVTFPIPFPNECFGVTFGEYTGPAPNWIALSGLPTASGFIAGSVAADQGYMWFAKGR